MVVVSHFLQSLVKTSSLCPLGILEFHGSVQGCPYDIQLLKDEWKPMTELDLGWILFLGDCCYSIALKWKRLFGAGIHQIDPFGLSQECTQGFRRIENRCAPKKPVG